MTILGSTGGWFDTLANASRRTSRGILNSVSFGHRWGDTFYKRMERVTETHVQSINDNAIETALAQGADMQQALRDGSDAMRRIHSPTTAADLGALAKTGVAIASDSVLKPGEAPKTNWMTGAAVIGAAVLAALCLYEIDTQSQKAAGRRRNLSEPHI
jgi:hypothetical protein